MKVLKIKQCGRSIVEMLGVLGIIGVLSVGSVWGYSYAMRQWKASKIIQNVGTYAMTIKMRGKTGEKDERIAEGNVEFDKLVDGKITASWVGKNKFRIDVTNVDQKLCHVVLTKAQGLKKIELLNEKDENSIKVNYGLLSESGVINDNKLERYTGNNLDRLCLGRNKTVGFLFEMFGQGTSVAMGSDLSQDVVNTVQNVVVDGGETVKNISALENPKNDTIIPGVNLKKPSTNPVSPIAIIKPKDTSTEGKKVISTTSSCAVCKKKTENGGCEPVANGFYNDGSVC